MDGRSRAQIGSLAEEAAAEYLAAAGYLLVEADVRLRSGQVDIVMRDGDTVVIVEVKARHGSAFGHPAEAVAGAKLRRLERLAAEYLAVRQSWGCSIRIDVVAVELDAAGRPSTCAHIKDVLV